MSPRERGSPSPTFPSPTLRKPRRRGDKAVAVALDFTKAAFMEAAVESVIQRWGRVDIINIALQAGHRGEALVSIYCASKAAVISITQSAGLDLTKHRINVNGLRRVVDTAMWTG